MRADCDTLSMGNRITGKDVIVMILVLSRLDVAVSHSESNDRKNSKAMSVTTDPGETAVGNEAGQLGVSRCLAALGMH